MFNESVSMSDVYRELASVKKKDVLKVATKFKQDGRYDHTITQMLMDATAWKDFDAIMKLPADLVDEYKYYEYTDEKMSDIYYNAAIQVVVLLLGLKLYSVVKMLFKQPYPIDIDDEWFEPYIWKWVAKNAWILRIRWDGEQMTLKQFFQNTILAGEEEYE